MNIKVFSLLLLHLPTLAFAAGTTESEQLTLVLRQLNRLENTLNRAEQSADISPAARYYFDYRQAHRDIASVRRGIEHYLIPERAQPRSVAELVTQYRRERTTP